MAHHASGGRTPASATGSAGNGKWEPVPILMYHAVESQPRDRKYKHFYVTAPEFRFQMHFLRRAGYHPIDLDTLESAMDGNAELPSRPVVLTFDDGYENLATNVDPILREFGWPYTVFLVSDRIGGRNEWVVDEGYEATPLLSWEQIEEMAAGESARFEAHGCTHCNLALTNETKVREEITGCRSALADKLGRPMRHFCYPYGGYNDTVLKVISELNMGLCVTTDFGRVRLGDDRRRLPRVSVYHVPPLSLTYGIGPINFWWRIASRNDTRPVTTSVASDS